jgi:YgiT-type zinc finger domain-containing protein
MNCIHCKGSLSLTTAPFQISRNGYHVVFDAVPAWVCTQCGEIYYDEPAVEMIQEALHALDQQAEKMRVPA